MYGSSVALITGTLLLALLGTSAPDDTAEPVWKTPAVSEGKIVVLPEAAFQPQGQSSVVFDVTEQKNANEVAKGLIRVARWVNLNAAGGVYPKAVSMTVVMHGDATKVALADDAYHQATGERNNPNLKLVEQLHDQGVEFYVCGQALAHKGFAMKDVVPVVRPATAALTVLIQRQTEGAAVLTY